MAAQYSSSHNRYLQALGIERWVLRQPPQKEAGNVVETASTAVALPDPALRTPVSQILEFHNPSTMDWESLARCVALCTKCNLHGGRTSTVFGVGSRMADWMIIGEAPGAEEDARGEPFVGRAGQLLNAMLQAVGLQRQQVYISNILKCRPPRDRDPQPEEVQECWPYLRRQIELVAPKVILAAGRIAAQSLLLSDEPIGRLRGRIHRHAELGIPVVVTYHPADLLRKPVDKRKAWEDLQLACHALEQVRS
jgi:DNA polymerase